MTVQETGVGQATSWTVVHRVVLPQDRDLDTLPLFVDSGAALRVDVDAKEGANESPVVLPPVQLHPDDILSERSIAVDHGERLSFGTYFNAFPASYWRRWTVANAVRLRVRLTDSASVIVYRSNARGVAQRVDSAQVDGGSNELVFDLTLAPFGDGGWYWFDIVAGPGGARLDEADWSVEATGRDPGTLSIAVTTFNRPDYCAALLSSLSGAKHLLAQIDEIFIIDQGNDKVREQPGFEEVETALEGKLRIIDQANLGGSGGFARGMLETTKSARSTYVMLLDDDIKIEPEGILRALLFADHCRRPTLVGGHMFDMYARSVLHTLGEVVDRYKFFYSAVKGLRYAHDLSSRNLRSTPWMHRRADVDYNAWWMCLIPTQVIREIGLSLPVFIKWDDAEYGLRAGAAGYRTVTLPGAAVWHVAFGEKDDTVDWQAYYHQRNRVLAALLYSPYERGGDLLRHSMQIDVKHLVSMQYYALQLRILALEDILKGPDHLHPGLPTTLLVLRSLKADFPDARTAKDFADFPTPQIDKPLHKGREPQAPNSALLVPWALKTVVRQLAKPVKGSALEHPQTQLAHMDSRWWRLAQYDSAIVSTADGMAASWYQRDPAKLRRLLARSLRLHSRVLREWPRLSAQYRAALPEFTSPAAWEQHFTGSDDQRS